MLRVIIIIIIIIIIISTKFKRIETKYKGMDNRNVSRSTVHKVSWSVKNRTKGKTYRVYIKRQLLVGRRICGHLVNLFNNQDSILFFDFLDKYYAKDCIYHEITKGPHPHTGEMNVNRVVQGIEVVKNMLKLSFKNSRPTDISIIHSFILRTLLMLQLWLIVWKC